MTTETDEDFLKRMEREAEMEGFGAPTTADLRRLIALARQGQQASSEAQILARQMKNAGLAEAASIADSYAGGARIGADIRARIEP